MKCDDIQERLGIYWDLPEHDINRQVVDEHITHCKVCAAEFEIWLESTALIKSVAENEIPLRPTSISKSVMERIYKDESWKVPVVERIYAFSSQFRRKVAAVTACCLALFVFCFLYSVSYEQHGATVAVAPEPSVFGTIGDPVVVTASSGGEPQAMNIRTMPSAVASLQGFNEPFMYQATSVHTYKDYLLFLSLIGFTSALLIMNWLSRTRS
ncbi:anti-sigma factor family protein [Paenibacillus xerothermodurans]|uniref:Zf-HC2 domain-containing protein n=1 Tax=Paenibacillus xerothermodurans TaxID=1977292 RepID=A0A2W1NTC3_PAEXE|nr:hypothetical protein [Paenibacillus xerothermodurans]PZE21933.1 zf-HC2 domain-containing protein [Paenibacillus xerothermodurans]